MEDIFGRDLDPSLASKTMASTWKIWHQEEVNDPWAPTLGLPLHDNLQAPSKAQTTQTDL